ncbi:hypothetical protein ALC57_06706 [Trachymyrmex cornetzi]|uniref:Uncharacterized protein n=1 Tax=Trachymyrmex cornetzi TaxID=471704 RepID=A0A195E6H0_9HYME|nr:hypothetical protein ALC57_06706 [Trachymyrmex cornetzi]
MIVESNGSCLPSAPAVVVMMGGDAEMAELVLLFMVRVEEATVVQMPAIETRIDKNYSGPGLSA